MDATTILSPAIMNHVDSYSPQPLVRSDTLEETEPPVWSNPRPLIGPTPLPPRNEPLLFIPEDDRHPTLLKLLYLVNYAPANPNISGAVGEYDPAGRDTSSAADSTNLRS